MKSKPATLLAAPFLAATAGSLFAFVLPLMTLHDKVSGSWLGSAFALYFLARLLAAPLAGAWTDAGGPRRPFLAACLLGLAAPVPYLVQPDHTGLLAMQLALGLASGMARPAAMAAMAASCPAEYRPLWLARLGSAGSAALLLGPILGGILYLDRNLEPVLAAVSLCMGLAAALGMLLPDIPARTKPEKEQASTPRQPSRSLPPLLLAITGRTLGIGALTAFYPLLLAQRLASDSLTLAAIFSVSSLVTMLAMPLAGSLLKGKNLIWVTVLGMGASSLALMGLGMGHAPWHFLALGAVMGLGAALSLPASLTLTAADSASPGIKLGAAHTAAGVGFLLGPVLGGLALSTTGSLNATLALPALVSLALLLPLMLAELRRRPEWSRPFTALTVLGMGLMLCGLIMASGILPRSQDSALYRYTDTAMGTVVRITLEEPDPARAEQAAQAVMHRIRRMQRDLDHRSPEGSLGRVNARAGKGPVRVTPTAAAILRDALHLAEASEGAFDPTIGAVTTLPFYFSLDPSVAESRQQFVDWRKVRMDGDMVLLEETGMALDLGGMAKGAIIDAAARELADMGIRSGMVEAGGDFACFGPRSWQLAVQAPRGADGETYETLRITNQALCTSGDYQRFVTAQTRDDARQHHILNPRTMGSATRSISVSVLAPTAREADGLATALFVLGPERGLEFLSRFAPHAAAQWVTPDMALISSDGFPAPEKQSSRNGG